MADLLKLEVKRQFTCDVLVVGGGVAGLSAAVCAARNGADVILCDKGNCLGGTATKGLVGPFMSAMDPTGQYQVIYGFLDEFIKRMEKNGGAVHPSKCKGGDGYSAYNIKGHIGCTPFDAESFKLEAEKVCLESGVRIIYDMFLLSCRTVDGIIQEACFAAKGGIVQISAKQFIDCTGDGDLARLSGAPMCTGDENGKTQVTSLFFLIDGIEKEKLEAYINRFPEETNRAERTFSDKVAAGKENGTFPCGRHRVSLFESVNNMWRVNMTQYDGDVDYCDPEQLTKATIDCRRQIPILMKFLKANVPGCENIRLLTSSEMLGIRESSRIDGEYTLTAEDVQTGRDFEDCVALSGDSIDIHGKGGSVYYVASRPTQIPFRCLLPKGVENLMVAGRCVSAEHNALAAVRVMPPCFAMGEAAGTAAALCVKEQVSPKQLETGLLKKTLIAQGVYLPSEDPEDLNTKCGFAK